MLVLCKHEDIYLSILYFFLLQKNNICRSTTLLLRIIILYVHIPQNNSQLATFLLDIIIPWEYKYIIAINIQKIICEFATLHFCKRDYVELRTFFFHISHSACLSFNLYLLNTCLFHCHSQGNWIQSRSCEKIRLCFRLHFLYFGTLKYFLSCFRSILYWFQNQQ